MNNSSPNIITNTIDVALGEAYFRLGRALLSESVTHSENGEEVTERMFNAAGVFTVIEGLDRLGTYCMDYRDRMKVYERLGIEVVKNPDGEIRVDGKEVQFRLRLILHEAEQE
jgi:hypothetical protein